MKHSSVAVGMTDNTMPTKITCPRVSTCHALPVMAKVAAAAQGPMDLPAKPALNIAANTFDLEPTAV